MIETWRAIPGYEGLYEVSDHGRIWSIPRADRFGRPAGGILVAISPNRNGYLVARLSRDGTSTTYQVHALVLTAFAGPRPPGWVARHGPAGKTVNEWPGNLCWGTYAENNADMVRDGTAGLVRGDRHGRTKLSEAGREEVREKYASGLFTQYQLAAMYGVSQYAIWAAVHHRHAPPLAA